MDPPRLSKKRILAGITFWMEPADLMPRVTFNKPALSTAEHIALLLERGMVIPDLDEAENCLRGIGYYRLSGYWRVSQYLDGSEKHDHFRPGTDFRTVMRRYDFDSRLRLCSMGGIEKIEVAARAAISDVMSVRHGSHWFLDISHFVRRLDHMRLMQKVHRVTGISPSKKDKLIDFVRHYIGKYDHPPEPPIWMIVEILSLGTISHIFSNLHNAEKNEIADTLGLPRRRLQSWLHSTSHLRNLCAHHYRIWNRRFSVVPLVAESERHHVRKWKHYYNHAVAMQTLLKTITGDNRWAEELKALLVEYSDIPLHLMGFPTDWEKMGVWCGSEKTEPA